MSRTTPPTNPLAERLEAERIDRGLGVRAFAEDVLKISHGMLSKYLNGLESPSRRTVSKIADALGMSRSQIEALLPEPPPRQPADIKQIVKEAVQEAIPAAVEEAVRRLRPSPVMLHDFGGDPTEEEIAGVEAWTRRMRAEREARERQATRR